MVVFLFLFLECKSFVLAMNLMPEKFGTSTT